MESSSLRWGIKSPSEAHHSRFAEHGALSLKLRIIHTYRASSEFLSFDIAMIVIILPR
jgi:hypothetical protein